MCSLSGVTLIRLAASLWCLAYLCAPGFAYGATVSLEPFRFDDLYSSFTYTAAAGESNVVEVIGSREGSVITVVVTDPGASIAPEAGCVAEGPDQVRCQRDTGAFFFFGLDVRVGLGDRNDSAQVTFEPSEGFYPGASILGGPGHDRLRAPELADTSNKLLGGRGDDLLVGGDGNDHLDGGGGVDELRGGAGHNSLTDGDRMGFVDGDILDGGGDADLLYRSRNRPLRVDLRNHTSAGEAGERDRVTGVTDVEGGHGDDVLAGTRGANGLYGGGGADRLYGRGGDDALALQEPGVAVGGGGDDAISLVRAGTAICGEGRDQVGWSGEAALGVGPWLSRSCERISVFEAGNSETELFIRPPHPIAVNHDGRLAFQVPCLGTTHCSQRLTITRPRPPFGRLGSRRFRTPSAGRRITIKIPAKQIDQARRRPLRLRVRLDGAIDFKHEHRVSVAWRFDLNAPPR